jgi:hypothetical protein
MQVGVAALLELDTLTRHGGASSCSNQPNLPASAKNPPPADLIKSEKFRRPHASRSVYCPFTRRD